MAQQTPPPSTPARRRKQARLDHLNMGIAKTHRLSTQLVGIQLSGANLLALLVSAASVVAGTVSLVAERYPFNWPLLLSAGVIGLGLALLIEGLTLGSLIRIRLANRAIREIEEHLERELREARASLAVPDLAQPNGKQAMRHYRQMRRLLQQEYHQKCQQATRLHRKQRRFSLPLAAMGAICSAIAGGLFYHTILAGLGPVESLVLAILFPLVITGTFVSSEIQKDAQEDAIREGFGGGALTETAIRAETKLTSALAVHEHVLAYLEKPEAEQAIEEGARHLLTDILAELRGSSRQATRQVIITEEQGDDMTRQLVSPQKRGDQTSEEGKATGDTTTPISAKKDDTIVAEKTTGDMAVEEEATNGRTRPVPATQERSDTTPFLPVVRERDDTTALVLAQKDDTTREEEAVGDMPSFGTTTGSDATPFLPVVRERDDTTASGANATDDTTRQHVASQEEGDTTMQGREKTGDMTVPVKKDATMTEEEATGERQQPFSLSEQGKHAKDQDPVTIQILTYQAQHPQAKQAEVADALGIAIRTVQRKLAAWKHLQSGEFKR